MTLRVAIIGCGVVGRRRADVIQSTGTGEVRIVADLDVARATAAAEALGCDATTSWLDAVCRDDLDVVIVATTHNWLAPITVEALRHGKHVLVEKPMARTPVEARTILDEVEASGDGHRLVVKVGLNHRHHPSISQAHALLARGEIGEPYFVRCRYGHGGRPGYADEWRAKRELSGGGGLIDQGIHALDLCRWFLGEFAEAVGFTSTYFWFPNERQRDTDPVEDNVFGLFRTTDGRIASVHSSWTQWKNLFSYEVFGRDGYLIAQGLGRSYGQERLIWGRRRPESGPPDEQCFEFPEGDSSWEAEWREFVTAIHEGRKPLGDGYDGWQALRMAHALYASTETRAVVRLDDHER
jgi:predicted dehydrogenase